MISILLALNDKSCLTVMSYHLERAGYIVNSCTATDEIINSINRIEPQIIVIDKDIPGKARLQDVCAAIKSKSRTKNIHIIMASSTNMNKSELINDSIVKPFAPSELMNKIHALKLDISSNTNSNPNKILVYNGVEMNVNSFRVARDGKVIHLGPTEFKILQCFLELPEKVLSREHIMNHVWGFNSDVEPRTIDVHINRLRLALKNNNDDDSIIRTIRSSGYSLNITMNNFVRV